MDLVLVNPNDRITTDLSAIEPPFWCMMLASYVKERGYSVAIVDAEAENLTPEKTAQRVIELNPRLVSIVLQGRNPSVSSTPKMIPTKEILKFLCGYHPILIGIHPSALPYQTSLECETALICQGEGFETLVGLLRGDILSEIPGLGERGVAPLITNLPTPDWGLIDMSLYRAHNWHCWGTDRKPYGVLYTSLGCPYSCYYCNIKTLYNNIPGIRYRALGDIELEVSLLVEKYHVKNIKIMDEIFTLRPDRIRSICDILKGNGLNIWAYARVDKVNKDLLIAIKDAGINWLCYGFESANLGIREGMGKSYLNSLTDRVIKETQEAGINILANFIFGLPDDTYDTMQQTLNMAKLYNFEFVNFYVAIPYPGSRLFRNLNINLNKFNKQLTGDWGAYAQYSPHPLTLGTKYVTPQAVVDSRDKAFREYIERPEYLDMIRHKFGEKAIKEIGVMKKWNPRK